MTPEFHRKICEREWISWSYPGKTGINTDQRCLEDAQAHSAENTFYDDLSVNDHNYNIIKTELFQIQIV